MVNGIHLMLFLSLQGMLLSPKSLEMQLGDKRCCAPAQRLTYILVGKGSAPVGHSDLHFVGKKRYVPRLFDATHPHELSFSVIGGE